MPTRVRRLCRFPTIPAFSSGVLALRMHRDSIALRYNTAFTLRDSNGNVKPLWQPNALGKLFPVRIPGITGAYVSTLRTHNLVTDIGHVAAVASLTGGTGGSYDVLAIGIGTTAAAGSDTALESEITTGGGARATATATSSTTTVTNDTVTLSKTWTFTDAFAVSEEGILNSTTVAGSKLLARQVFAVINVAAGDQLTISHSVTA